MLIRYCTKKKNVDTVLTPSKYSMVFFYVSVLDDTTSTYTMDGQDGSYKLSLSLDIVMVCNKYFLN